MITAAMLWKLQELALLLGIACTAGHPFGLSVHAWILIPAVFGAGLSTKRKAWVLLSLIGVFLPGLSVYERIIAGLLCAKTVCDAYKDRFVPQMNAVESAMKTLVMVDIVLLIALLMMENASEAGSTLLLCALLSLGSGLMLKRTLRHDPEVYDQPGFQAVNLVSAVTVVLAGCLITSEPVRTAMFLLIRWIWMRLFLPAVTLVVYALLVPFLLLGKLLDLLHFKAGSTMEETVQTIMEETNGFHLEDYEITVHERISLFIPLMVTLSVIVLILLYRSWRSTQAYHSTLPITATAENRAQSTADTGYGDVRKIRRLYRKYLKRAEKHAERVPSDTSLTISRKSAGIWPQEILEEMRSLYIRARYQGTATRKDAARMKELYNEIRREENR